MIYRLFLILFLIWFIDPQSVFAENERYRVEVLVLTHLDHGQQGTEAVKLEDFSSALDFLQPPEEETEPVGEADAEEPADVEPEPVDEQALVEVDPAELEAEVLNAVVHVDEMGPEMQEAWRRLRLSGPFRPLQFLAWEQGSNPPFPTLRVHDADAVLIEDPWAEQRLEESAHDADSPLPGESVTGSAPAMPPVTNEDENDDGIDDEGEDALPDPISYYRLDGTARLIRTRFLHLALALEWREPVYDPMQPALPDSPALEAGLDGLPIEPLPSGFLVHRLEQSRPVRTGRMEYFDGPVLGVLAWVTEVTDQLDPAAVE
jgi:hypothetical protein